MTKYLFLFLLILTGCASPKIQQVENNIYNIVREDHAGIFGSMSSFRAEVAEEVQEFARKRNKIIVKISYKEKPVGMTPGSWARIEYTFKLVDKFNLEISDEKLKDIDFADVNKLKSSIFSSSNLDAIEGIWSWTDDKYKVAIIKNTYTSFSDYEYIGLVSKASSQSWVSGDVKILLNSTASKNVYIGAYIMENKTKEGVTFFLKDNNLIEVDVPVGGNKQKEKVLIVRNYPKSNEYFSNETPSALSQGSCFFVSEAGLVVTNHHVIKNKKRINIIDHNGDEFEAVIKKLDPSNDLAVLKVKADKHKHLKIAPSGSARTGLEIFSVGYPVSSILGSNVKFTNGVVSSVTGMNNMANMFQMTVPIQPGNSGGPVVNMKGEVIGVATSTAAVEAFFNKTGALPQNVNWAIKSEYLSLLINGNQSVSNLSTRQEAIDAAIGASCMVKASS